MTRWSRALAALASVGLGLVAACSGGDSNAPDCDAIAAALVTRIEVRPPTATVNLGDSLQMQAVAYSCAGALNDVTTFTWRSADAAKVAVSANGLVKAITSGGPTAVFAAAQGKEGSSAVTTRPTPVAKVVVEPATTTVGVGRTSTLTATAYDAQNRIISGRPVTWSSANTAIVSVSSSGGITGVAAGGPVAVTATIEGQSGASQVSVTTIPVNTVTLAPADTTIAAGTNFTYRVTLRDELGNVLTGRTVNFTSSDPTIASIAGATGVVTGLRPGTVTITATSEGKTATARLTVQIGAAAKLAFVQQPSAVQAGSVMAPVTVEVQDAAGNRVQTSGTTVTLALTSPGGATLGGGTATTVNGLATFSNLTVSAAGTYSLTATSSGLTPATSGSFTVTARPATRLAFVQQPTIDTAGKAITPAITVELQDAVGGRVTTSGVAITIAIGTNPSAGTLGGTLTQTTVNGVATFANLTLDKAGTGYTLVASASGLTPATSTAFDIVPGAPARLGLVTQPCAPPATCRAGSPLTPSAQFEVLDANGNRVTSGPGANATVTVAATTKPGGSTLTGTLSVTAANGLATFGNLIVDKSGSYVLTASATVSSVVLTSASTAAFNVGSGTGSVLSITTTLPTSIASGSTLPSISVQLLDANSNPVASAGVDVSLSLSPTTGSLSGTLTQSTNASGVATFTGITISAAAAASYTLVASATGYASDNSNSFSVTAGSATRVTFVQNPPATVTVGTAITPAVTVQLRDAFGNASAQSGVSITLTMSGGGTLTNATVSTNTSGLATFTGLTATATAGSGYTLTAASGSLTPATSTSFSVAAGAATSLRFVQQPTTVTAGSTITPAVTVEALDAAGNRATGFTSAVAVALTSPGGATLGGTTSVNAVAGVATFSTLTVNQAGTYSLTATRTGLTPATSASFTVNPLPTFTLTVVPAGAGAGTVTSSTGGISCPATCAATLASGTAVVLTATPNGSSTFASWTGCPSATGNQCTIASLTANTTVTATYTLQTFTLTASTSGSGTGTLTSTPIGISCPADCTEPYASGTTVVLTEAAQPNSYFGAFTGCGSTTATTCTVTMSTARSVSASFILLPTITTTTLDPATVGAAYGPAPLAVSGGAGPFTWTVSVGTLPDGLTLSAGGVISGTPTATATSQTFTVQVTDAGAQSDTQVLTINVASGGTSGATQVGFLTLPSNSNVAGAPLTPTVQVEIRDASGARVTTSTASVTLTLATNPTGAVLSGNSTQAQAGVASFPSLTVSAPGTGYTLLASSDGLASATSQAFRIR